jgi:predicted lipoprotein with Yx(FWY)xxD motif
MRIHRLCGLLLALGVTLTACGVGNDKASTAPTKTAKPAAAKQAAGESISIKAGDTSLGKILVDRAGQTLYGFTNDTAAASTCFGSCAEAWPPVLVSENWTVGPGLDSAVFSTIIRADGKRQLVAGKWPLYAFSGDAKPGDLTGQGSGDVWFVVGLDAKLIKTPAPATGESASSGEAKTTGGNGAVVTTGKTSLGDVLVDADGHTLYGLTKDVNGTSTCVDGCATAWPPLTVEGNAVPAGLDTKLYSVIKRADGSWQLKAGKWPLYRFSGDEKAGDINGQGSGQAWFAVAPDGTLHKGAAPAAGSTGSTDGPDPSIPPSPDY